MLYIELGDDMMRHLILIPVTAWLFAAGCSLQPPFEDPFTRPQVAWTPNLVLDIESAARVLGSESRLEKVTAYLDDQTLAYQSEFRNEEPDPATGKTGVLGYMFEEYRSAEAARSYLHSTLRANRLRPEDAILIEGGVELHYFTGTDVVRMVLILKENRLLRLKVNPVTSLYSLVEFKSVAAELARRL